jgi:predicted DNA-binding transcriptional regulator AlpA
MTDVSGRLGQIAGTLEGVAHELRELADTLSREDSVRSTSPSGYRKSANEPVNGGTGTPSRDELWDVEQVAAFLHRSESWVYHATSRGTMPCLSVGRRLLFDPAEIQSWVRRQRRATTPELLGRDVLNLEPSRR